MSREPNPLTLLEAARRTLVEEIAARLPGEQRYAVLLVANAVAIAGRELGADEALLRSEARSTATLLGEPPPPANEPAEPALAALEARLADAIRAGAFDTPTQLPELLAHLEASTRRKLREANPRFPFTPRATMSQGRA